MEAHMANKHISTNNLLQALSKLKAAGMIKNDRDLSERMTGRANGIALLKQKKAARNVTAENLEFLVNVLGMDGNYLLLKDNSNESMMRVGNEKVINKQDISGNHVVAPNFTANVGDSLLYNDSVVINGMDTAAKEEIAAIFSKADKEIVALKKLLIQYEEREKDSQANITDLSNENRKLLSENSSLKSKLIDLLEKKL